MLFGGFGEYDRGYPGEFGGVRESLGTGARGLTRMSTSSRAVLHIIRQIKISNLRSAGQNKMGMAKTGCELSLYWLFLGARG